MVVYRTGSRVLQIPPCATTAASRNCDTSVTGRMWQEDVTVFGQSSQVLVPAGTNMSPAVMKGTKASNDKQTANVFVNMIVSYLAPET